MGLVHTQGSILQAKATLNTIPEANEEEEEEENYYKGEGGSVDSISTDVGDDDEWLQVPSSFSLEDAIKDLKSKYKAAMVEPEPEDPIQKKIAQFYREILKMLKMQNVRLISTVKTLREEMENITSN